MQLTIKYCNYNISSNDAGEEHVMQPRSNNVKFTFFNDENDVVNELSESLRLRYQGYLATSTRGNEFIFNSVQLLYCECHKINFKRGSSYVDSPDWKRKKKTTTNPKNTDDKCST